jgi:intracellular multiplication protein IcmK
MLRTAVLPALLMCVAATAFAQVQRFGSPGQAPAAGAPSVALQPAQVPAQAGGSPAPYIATATVPPPGMPLPAPRVDLVNEAIDQTAPLTPEEMIRLRRELLLRGDALTANVSGRAPAQQVTSRYELDLSPGATPPVIRATPGQGVIVTFEDVNGKAWKVKLGDNFGSGAGVSVSEFTESSLSVGVSNHASVGNVAVALDGLSTPVVFTVVSGQPKTDYWVQMVVPRFLGGEPPAIVAAPLPSFKQRELADFLLRTPPAHAKRLQVDGLAGAMAWETRPGVMVLRTNAMVTSPTTNKLPSADGMAVYEMPVTPLVMATSNGRFVSIQVSGFTVGGVK